MRFDTSMDSLVNVTRSESVTDLNSELNGLPHTRRQSAGHARNDDNNFLTMPPKPYGIGKQFFIITLFKKRLISSYIVNELLLSIGIIIQLFIINNHMLLSSNRYHIFTLRCCYSVFSQRLIESYDFFIFINS